MQETKSATEKTHSSYLKKIQFDPKLESSFLAGYLTNIRIVLLLIISVTTLGIVSYLNLPRRLNPEIKIPLITVVTTLPGASGEDIEKLVTIPIENKIRGLSEIDQLVSTSSENVSVISVQFFNSITQEKAKAEVTDAVDSVTSLPEDASNPDVRAVDFEDQPIWTFTLNSNVNDLPSLMKFSEDLKTQIEELANVDRVNLTGFETQEFVVKVNQEKISQYGINPLQISSIIRSSLNSFPAGSVNTENNSFSLTIDPLVTSVSEIREVRLSIGQQTVKLGDIATVSEQSKPNLGASFIANRETSATRVVTFDVFKIQSAKIDQTANEVHKVVDEKLASVENRFDINTVTNTAEEVTRQFSDLLSEFRSTILLVFACLFIFLGLRQAVIATFTVPLTFLSAFAFMSIFGMSINFLSLFAFLLALGLLVDDTIVVVSAMTTYYKTDKFTPSQTGLLVWRDTIVPIWSTTITTIWSFIPLLLSSGIIGEFIKPIPVVVTVTMISSTAIAVLITLPFMIVLLKPAIAKRVIILLRLVGIILAITIVGLAFSNNPLMPLIAILFVLLLLLLFRIRSKFKFTIPVFLSKSANHGVVDIEKFSLKYHNFIASVLASKIARRRVIIGVVVYSLIAFLLIPLGLVKNEFFPKVEADLVYLNLKLPPGTTLQKTIKQTSELLENLRVVNGIEFAVAQIGRGIGGFGLEGSGSNNVLFSLHLPDKEKKEINSIELAQSLREKYSNWTMGELTVEELSGGPPAGADVQIALLGEELGQLNTYADQLLNYLQNQQGITNARKSINPGTSALVFVPDLSKLSQNNITIEQIGLLLRSFASGFTLDEVSFNKNEESQKEIVFRFSDTIDTKNLGGLVVTTPTGSIPLLSLGSIRTKPNPTSITREDGKRTISVSASVLPEFSIQQKNNDLLDYANSLDLESGYSIKTGGVNEENERSVQSILQAMVVTFILILVTMVIQFKSYRQAIIVLLVIPLAISSVFYIFALTGTPLSFPALIGVLSLFGIVVTNSMFIVDKINLNRKQGMEFIESIADAGASRLEPIILTKLCTVLGLLPITLADPLWRGLGGAIISGILISSTIMLLFIPVVYYQWFKPNDNA